MGQPGYGETPKVKSFEEMAEQMEATEKKAKLMTAEEIAAKLKIGAQEPTNSLLRLLNELDKLPNKAEGDLALRFNELVNILASK